MSETPASNVSKFPIRKLSNSMERKGVAYVREIVESSNCVFKEIDRADDYGHDAFVLLVDDERVTPCEFALQIKAGQSFRRTNGYAFSAKATQLNFWAKHPFLTLGVVFDPKDNTCYWVNLREKSRTRRPHSENMTIKIPKEEWNKFDANGFREVILPLLLGEPPRLSMQRALDWAASRDLNTHDFGANVLLTRYKEQPDTWRTFLTQFRQRGRNSSFSVFRGLVRIMGHPDEGYYADEVPKKLREKVKLEISRFNKQEIIELLHFVDESGYERGSAGYGLFAIFPRIPDFLGVLMEIASDENQEAEIKENALLLLAIREDDPDWWSLWER